MNPLTFSAASQPIRPQATPRRLSCVSQHGTPQQDGMAPGAVPQLPARPRAVPLQAPQQLSRQLVQLHQAQQAGHDVRNDTLRSVAALERCSAPAPSAALVGNWELVPNTAPTLFGQFPLHALHRGTVPQTLAQVHTIRLSISDRGRVQRSAHFRADDGREGVVHQYGRLAWEGTHEVRLSWKGTTLRLGDEALARAGLGLPALPLEVPYADGEVFLMRRYNGYGPQSVLGWKRV